MSILTNCLKWRQITTALTLLQNVRLRPMFDEYFNGATLVVLKSSDVSTADASDTHHQQNTTLPTSTTIAADQTKLNIQTTPEPTSKAPTVTTTENNDQA
ncbi:hypothetical protein Tco_0346821 [Tanacetum coccineum]